MLGIHRHHLHRATGLTQLLYLRGRQRCRCHAGLHCIHHGKAADKPRALPVNCSCDKAGAGKPANSHCCCSAARAPVRMLWKKSKDWL
jgi:hypothetical protein